jgi:hypothetical protein
VVARVPNPILNALCVNANKTELAPIVYETWPNANLRLNTSSEPPGSTWVKTQSSLTEINNQTVLDNLFGWRDQTGPNKYTQADEIRPSERASSYHANLAAC